MDALRNAGLLQFPLPFYGSKIWKTIEGKNGYFTTVNGSNKFEGILPKISQFFPKLANLAGQIRLIWDKIG